MRSPLSPRVWWAPPYTSCTSMSTLVCWPLEARCSSSSNFWGDRADGRGWGAGAGGVPTAQEPAPRRGAGGGPGWGCGGQGSTATHPGGGKQGGGDSGRPGCLPQGPGTRPGPGRGRSRFHSDTGRLGSPGRRPSPEKAWEAGLDAEPGASSRGRRDTFVLVSRAPSPQKVPPPMELPPTHSNLSSVSTCGGRAGELPRGAGHRPPVLGTPRTLGGGGAPSCRPRLGRLPTAAPADAARVLPARPSRVVRGAHLTFTMDTPEPMLTRRYGKMSG